MTPDHDRLRELAERALAQSDPLHVVPTITLAPQRVLALLDDLRGAEAERDRFRQERNEARALTVSNAEVMDRALAERDRLRAAIGLIGSVCNAEASLAPDPPAGT